MSYESIGVVGAGVIGAGVTQSLAQTGHRVIFIDITDEILECARIAITKNLRWAAMFDQDLRNVNHQQILDRIQFTTSYRELRDVRFIVENSTESWAIKQSIYQQLDGICHKDCVFAANTSAIPITRLATTTQRPSQVIGMHFMNPVPQKEVVEVIKGKYSSKEAVQAAEALLQRMGKRAIIVKDSPGFVSNRVLMVTINEAIFVVQDEVASPADIDKIFVGCFAHKMGPLATADLIGLDTVLKSLEILHESYNDSKYRPCPLLSKMVDAGLLGRKSGRGFFDYIGHDGREDTD